MSALLTGTSHSGTFYLPPDHDFEHVWAEQIWRNLVASEERWHLANQPIIRELVDHLEARDNLDDVMDSTHRVAIVGYASEGRLRFRNVGYRKLFGTDDVHVEQLLVAPRFREIQDEVGRHGSWVGPVRVSHGDGLEGGLFLSATAARDEEGHVVGITMVFSDFSGEEERIRTQAIRTVLGSVPYALFVVDAQGVVQDGYSDACRELFTSSGSFSGQLIGDAIGLERREAESLLVQVLQTFDGFLDPEIALGMLPRRLDVGGRTLRLSGKIVRDERRDFWGILFTCADISELSEAEREVEAMRGTLQVLRHRRSFESFVRTFREATDRLCAESDGSQQWELRARRHLHTAKGVFAQFHLDSLVRTLHGLEGVETLGPQHLRWAWGELHAFLASNDDVGAILDDDEGRNHEVEEGELQLFIEGVKHCEDLAEAVALAEAHVERVRRRPIESLLGPMRERVRRLAEDRGKKVRLTMEGTDLRIPSHLLPVLDHLTHLLTNAVDHGIEGPDARGDKSWPAVVEVEFRWAYEVLQIEVRDDGRGIDEAALVRRALALGLVSDEEAAALSRSERLQLVFSDRLSTASTVTEVSGRGIGLGAVRSMVESLGGWMEVESQPGGGTTFRISLPAGARACAERPPDQVLEHRRR